MTRSLHDVLTAPPAPHEISWKLQSRNREKTQGQLVAYLDGQYYETRLDQAVTEGALDSWSEVTDLLGLQAGELAARCLLTLTLPGGAGVVRTGIGAAAQDSGSTASLAKTAATDAFKRACARAGLGRFLYALPILRAPLTEGRLDRATQDRLPGLTEGMMADYLGGMDADALERKYAWVLTRGGASTPADPALGEARAHLTRIEGELRRAGKGTQLTALLRDHPQRLRSVEDARAAYAAMNALLRG